MPSQTNEPVIDLLSRDAQVAAEHVQQMADAALRIMEHPLLTSTEQEIWRLWCEGEGYAAITAAMSCSNRAVQHTVDKCKTLMLQPDGPWAEPPPAPDGGKYTPLPAKPKRPRGRPTKAQKAAERKAAGIPPEVPPIVGATPTEELDVIAGELCLVPPNAELTTEERFADLEKSIEMGVETAHRKIVELHRKPYLTHDDIEANERALRTMISVRKAELEYLRATNPAAARKVGARK